MVSPNYPWPHGPHSVILPAMVGSRWGAIPLVSWVSASPLPRVCALATAGLLVSVQSVHDVAAGGLAVPGAGPQAQARAGAFVAKADDPTAIAHNPAGFATMTGTVLLLGVNLLSYDLEYQRTGRYESTGSNGPDYEGQDFPLVKEISRPGFGVGDFQAIPTIAVATDLGHPEWPVRFGFGIYAPQGYSARKYAREYDVGTTDLAPAPQRYDIVEQSASAVLPSLVVAYAPSSKLSVGVRLSWGFAKAHGRKVVWSVRNYEEDPGADSLFTLDTTDRFVPSAGVGVLYRATPWLEIGASYNSSMALRTKGTGSSIVGGGVLDGLETVPKEDQFAICEPGGVKGALKACLDVDIAQQATIGARYVFRDGAGNERGDIELDVRWEDWSAASNTKIVVDGRVDVAGDAFLPLNAVGNRHGFRDVASVRLGGAYAFPVALPFAESKLIVRAGAAYDSAAAPDSWTRVDLDGKARTTLASGLALETKRFRVDIGGGVSLERDITVAPCQPPDGPSFANPGCDGSGTDRPVLDRSAPDPAQPRQGPLNQVESPFNAGSYKSGYQLLSVGVTTWF